MHIISIILSSKYSKNIDELYNNLNSLSDEFGAVFNISSNKHISKIHVGLLGDDLENPQLDEDIAQILSQYIVKYIQDDLVSSIIGNKYLYKGSEALQIFNKYLELKNDSVFDLSGDIFEYFKHDIDLNVDGFLNFRASKYKECLEDLVEICIDDYLMKEQYEEFINLLQYFVYINQPKIGTVNVIHTSDNQFNILDDSMKPIDQNILTHDFGDIELKDIVVSNLIGLSPSRICIQSTNKDHVIINTIKSIFKDRVVFKET